MKFLENTPGFYHSMTKEASVVCCSLDGTSCSRKTVNGNCYFGNSKVSWKQAFEVCKDSKMRLCDSQEELNQCCGAGCGLDDKLIWSNVLEGIAQWCKTKKILDFIKFSSLSSCSQKYIYPCSHGQ